MCCSGIHQLGVGVIKCLFFYPHFEQILVSNTTGGMYGYYKYNWSIFDLFSYTDSAYKL